MCIRDRYTNLEIVVVNDGSTDDSLDIIKTYAAEDPRIVVFNKQNEGLVQARKSGIEMCIRDRREAIPAANITAFIWMLFL